MGFLSCQSAYIKIMISLDSFPSSFNAIVIGASGGIGQSFCEALAAHPQCAQLHRLSRRQGDGHIFIDLDDELSIEAAAKSLAPHGPFHLIINATGILHGDGLSPEKTWRHLNPDVLLQYYQTNCIAPAMAAKHFLPLLAKQEKAVFAALSAKVGSIADNKLGGWHGYRAAKAGLNMMIRNFAVEMRLKSPSSIVIGLHPGTVETNLSAPFRGMISHEVFTPEIAIAHMLKVINSANPEQSGHQLAWDGGIIPG